MAKEAAQRVRGVPHPTLAREGAVVIDMRTRRPWRSPDARVWPFLIDVGLTFTLVSLASWLFHKMQGG